MLVLRCQEGRLCLDKGIMIFGKLFRDDKDLILLGQNSIAFKSRFDLASLSPFMEKMNSHKRMFFSLYLIYTRSVLFKICMLYSQLKLHIIVIYLFILRLSSFLFLLLVCHIRLLYMDNL